MAVKDQSSASVYDLRALLAVSSKMVDVYRACNNPSMQSPYDAAMLVLRDALIQRYPLDTFPNQATVTDQQPINAPVLNVLGVSLSTGAKLTVTSGVVVGIKLL